MHRVKKITTEKGVVREAAQMSDQLEVSKNGEMVRRKIPYKPIVIGPEYSVYVEGLSSQWDHDVVGSIFSRCGEIAHIGLPKSRQSNAYRGFAFIEFKNGRLYREDYVVTLRMS